MSSTSKSSTGILDNPTQDHTPVYEKLTIKEKLLERKIEKELAKELQENGQIIATNHAFLNNVKLKRAGVQMQFTNDQALEYAKCSQDVVYFARRYMKIVNVDHGLMPFDMYPFQEEMARQIQEERFNIFVQCRQSGKCVTENTPVDIKFLDSKPYTVPIGIVHQISKSINRFKNRRSYYVFTEQVHKNILFDNKQEKEVFNRLWRSASYNSKKLWWEQLSGQPCDVNSKRTLSLSQNITKNIDRQSTSRINGNSTVYDDTHSRRNQSFDGSTVSKIERTIHQKSITQDDWRWKPILWQKTRNTPAGYVWEESFSENDYKGVIDNERIVGNSGIPKKSRRSDKQLDRNRSSQRKEYSYIEEFKETLFQPGKSPENKRTNESTRSQKKNIREAERSKAFGRTQKEVINCGYRSETYRRINSKNEGCSERESIFEGTQKEYINSGKESTDVHMPPLRQSRERWCNETMAFRKLQDEKKFIETYDFNGFYVYSDRGYEPLCQSHKTIKYDIYELNTKSYSLKCADNHIVFDEYYNEIFVKDLVIGQNIHTKNGIERVESVTKTQDKVNMYDLGVDSKDHRYFTGGILSHNSTTCVAALLHYLIFNDYKSIAIIANKGITAREILGRLQLAYQQLPLWLQSGVIAWNKGSIELENGSKCLAAATSSSAIRGFSINLLFVDEVAFIPENIWTEFYKSVYPTISSGLSTKIVLVSTVNKMNHFYKLVMGARKGIENGGNAYKIKEVIWSDVPGRDEAWKRETIANTDEQSFLQEQENHFLGGQGTLIGYSALKKMEAQCRPPNTRSGGLCVYMNPIKDHTYVMTVDVSRGVMQDYSTFSVIDVTCVPYVQVATFRRNDISTLLLPSVIQNVAEQYNNAYVLVENNDMGGAVIQRLNYDLEYENILSVKNNRKQKAQLGIRTTARTKMIGCHRMKEQIESDQLIIYDESTTNELFNFVENKTSYAAEAGQHDDMVMTLVIFSFLSTTELFKDITESNFEAKFMEMRLEELHDNVLPLPIIDNGLDDDGEDFDFDESGARPSFGEHW